MFLFIKNILKLCEKDTVAHIKTCAKDFKHAIITCTEHPVFNSSIWSHLSPTERSQQSETAESDREESLAAPKPPSAQPAETANEQPAPNSL